MISLFTAVLAASAPLSPQEAPKQPEILSASADWVMDYGKSRCRVGNIFGKGENRAILFFEQYTPGERLRWLISSHYLIGEKPGREVPVKFGSDAELFTVEYEGRNFPDFGNALDGEWRPESDSEATGADEASNRLIVEEGKAIEWIEIAREGKPPLRLDTGGLGPIYEAMNTCMDNLVASWGLDPQQDRTRAKAPVFTNEDKVYRKLWKYYPTDAAAQGVQADRHMRLMIDANGKVTDCVLVDVTVANGFDDKICGPFLRDAKFEPARDADGNGIPSYHPLFIKFRLD